MKSLMRWFRKRNIAKEKVAIYTAIINDYDELIEPEYIDENCDYYCFTDSPNITSNTWKIIHTENTEKLDSSRWQRRYKMLPWKYLPQYKYSLFIDGNVRIRGSMREYIEKYSKGNPMLCLRHPERDCIYEEAETCINLGKDNKQVIKKQISGYRLEGYPSHNGLIVGNILFRAHNDAKVQAVMEAWWNEVKTKSRRDQLSFNYVAWKNHFEYDAAPLLCWDSPYWKNSGAHTLSHVIKDGKTFFSDGSETIPNSVIGPVTEETSIAQVFTTKIGHINRIEVCFATYMKQNFSQMILRLEKYSDHEVLLEMPIDVSELQDNAFAAFQTDLCVEKGTQYALYFVPSCTEQGAITIYRSKEDSASETDFALIDGMKQNYKLCVNLYKRA